MYWSECDHFGIQEEIKHISNCLLIGLFSERIRIQGSPDSVNIVLKFFAIRKLNKI